MKHHALLRPFLLVALACTPVYAVWTYQETPNYFSQAAENGISSPERVKGSPIPAFEDPPPLNSNPASNGYPKAPGAMCTQEKLNTIGDTWNMAIRLISVAEVRHELQMKDGVFTPNAAFRNFIAADNYRVLSALPGGPQTLYESLSVTMARMKEVFANPPAPQTQRVTVTCYDHFWFLYPGATAYQDVCEIGAAFVMKQSRKLKGVITRFQHINFCPAFFTIFKPWYLALQEITRDPPSAQAAALDPPKQAAVDNMELAQVHAMIHEWTHYGGIMWMSSEDFTYTARNCRKLTNYHNTMTTARGNGQISARHTPGNADSEALYIMSLAMDSTLVVRNLYGTGRNVGRRSAAEPEPLLEREQSPERDRLFMESMNGYKEFWESRDWRTSMPAIK